MLLLDIQIDGFALFFFIFVAVITILLLTGNAVRNKKDVTAARIEIQDLKLLYQTKINELAQAEFEKYKATQLESDKKFIEDIALESAATMLQQWKIDNEAIIRKDAANRSLAVNLGQVTEHWLPYHPSFKFNPKDARFMGSPVDLIVFDGLSDNNPIINIYFIEVKTGNSRLTPIQQKIKASVNSKLVNWVEMNPATLK